LPPAPPQRTALGSFLSEDMPISLAEANRAIDAALVKAGELDITVSISVCDEVGRLVAHQRMDGVFAVAPSDSIGEAIGAATPGHSDESGAQKSPTNVVMEGAPVIIGPGGLPIMRSGELEGAIGVSGAPDNEHNAECAKAGVDGFAQTLIASNTR
jgi:uncharacterized protein GlcG (DUF336 family)